MDEVFDLQASFACLLREVHDDGLLDRFKAYYELCIEKWDEIKNEDKDENHPIRVMEEEDELTQIKKQLKQLAETTVKKAELADIMAQVPKHSDIVEMLISGKLYMVNQDPASSVLKLYKVEYSTAANPPTVYVPTVFVLKDKAYYCLDATQKPTLVNISSTLSKELEAFGAVAEFTEIFNNWQKYTLKVTVNKGTAKEKHYIGIVEKYYNLGFALAFNAFKASIHRSIFNASQNYKKIYEDYKKTIGINI